MLISKNKKIKSYIYISSLIFNLYTCTYILYVYICIYIIYMYIYKQIAKYNEVYE